MSSSLGDKERLLEFVDDGRVVVDIGCGSGDLLDVLLDRGYDAVGVDSSSESLVRANSPERIRIGYADEVNQIMKRSQTNTVICSAVMHEVFSYGNRRGTVGRIKSVSNALNAIRNILVTDGILIIRDGVKPPLGDAALFIDDEQYPTKFRNASPFCGYPPKDRSIAFTQDKIHRTLVSGSRSSLMELAFTYTWGEDAFTREVQEYYGLYNLKDYAAFVEKHGFELIHSEEYVQQGYVDHLKDKITFIGMDFPMTNAVWIYRKI